METTENKIKLTDKESSVIEVMEGVAKNLGSPWVFKWSKKDWYTEGFLVCEDGSLEDRLKFKLRVNISDRHGIKEDQIYISYSKPKTKYNYQYTYKASGIGINLSFKKGIGKVANDIKNRLLEDAKKEYEKDLEKVILHDQSVENHIQNTEEIIGTYDIEEHRASDMIVKAQRRESANFYIKNLSGSFSVVDGENISIEVRVRTPLFHKIIELMLQEKVNQHNIENE